MLRFELLAIIGIHSVESGGVCVYLCAHCAVMFAGYNRDACVFGWVCVWWLEISAALWQMFSAAVCLTTSQTYLFIFPKLFHISLFIQNYLICIDVNLFIYLFIYLKWFYMYLPEFICLFSMLIFIYSILLYILFIYIYLLKVIFIFISTFMHVKYLLFFCSKLLLICFAKIISY